MKLFLLKNKQADYGEDYQILVRAETEYKARRAATESYEYGKQDWHAENCTCKEIPYEGLEEVIMAANVGL